MSKTWEHYHDAARHHEGAASHYKGAGKFDQAEEHEKAAIWTKALACLRSPMKHKPCEGLSGNSGARSTTPF